VAGTAVVVSLNKKKKIVIVLQAFWKFMCNHTILKKIVDG
jgi:hypothetical protein